MWRPAQLSRRINLIRPIPAENPTRSQGLIIHMQTKRKQTYTCSITLAITIQHELNRKRQGHAITGKFSTWKGNGHGGGYEMVAETRSWSLITVGKGR